MGSSNGSLPPHSQNDGPETASKKIDEPLEQDTDHHSAMPKDADETSPPARRNHVSARSNMALDGARLSCCTHVSDGEPYGHVRKFCRDGCRPSIILDCESRRAREAQTPETKARPAEDSVRSMAGSRPSRAVDDILRMAGLDQSSLQKLSGRASGTGSEATYIFSPRHPETACYMFRREDAEAEDSYEFEHVPVKAVHGFGRSAYLMAMAQAECNEDEATGLSPRNERTPQGPTSKTGKAESRPSAPSASSGDGWPRSCEQQGGDDSGSRDIGVTIRRVLSQLRVAAERRSIFHPNDGEGGPLYLVSERDVAHAMTLALSEPRRCPKFSASTSCLPKLHSRTKAIMPSPPAAAEPATTISLPQTSFSSLGVVSDMDSTRAPTTRATVVSRQSATEIVWAENEGYRRFSTSSRNASEPFPSIRWRCHSPPSEPDTPYATQGCPLLQDATRRNGSSTEGSQTLSLIDDASMTSFPELPRRQCTNEWLNPPASMEQINKGLPSDLYRMGIDAHGDGSSLEPGAHRVQGLQELAVDAMRCNQTLFSGDPFQHVGAHRTGDGAASASRMGSSIGSAAHRRRSSHLVDAAGRATWHAESSDGLIPVILDRLRKSEQRMFNDESNDTNKNNKSSSSSSSRSSRQHQYCHRHTRKHHHHHRPDCAGRRAPANTPRGRRVSIRADGEGLRHRSDDVCSEDNRPHVCADEMDDGSTGPE
ncbi:D-xylulose reductase A [Ophiocordyceps camponoti-floridani]|uniref:D-xylulose reductase A n=1 Tax=Ophiocordyceps camponoti-floridani TaxID=2030778 RepID=A0A8H4QDF5_9HYPO|nr:D-xylulose reductase A [Ophiocordyceps camponoti-floridani]